MKETLPEEAIDAIAIHIPFQSDETLVKWMRSDYMDYTKLNRMITTEALARILERTAPRKT